MTCYCVSPVHAQGGQPASRIGARRAAYSLLEMVVVVALIVVIVSLTAPSLRGLLVDARVTGSADLVRARMADARSMAIEQGVPVRFGFIPGTGKFQIAPDDASVWNSAQSGDPVEQDDLIRGMLLDEIVFATDLAALSSTSPPSASGNWELGGVYLPTGTARGATSSDGTMTDDVTFYFGRPGLAPMGVHLRGLTGAVRVFDSSVEGDAP